MRPSLKTERKKVFSGLIKAHQVILVVLICSCEEASGICNITLIGRSFCKATLIPQNQYFFCQGQIGACECECHIHLCIFQVFVILIFMSLHECGITFGLLFWYEERVPAIST